MAKPKLSVKDIDYIAKLARLQLSEEEKKTYTKQISEVLSYMDRLNKVDTKNVPPAFQVALDPFSPSALRSDKPRTSLSQKAALSAAAKTNKNYIVVPQTIKK